MLRLFCNIALQNNNMFTRYLDSYLKIISWRVPIVTVFSFYNTSTVHCRCHRRQLESYQSTILVVFSTFFSQTSSKDLSLSIIRPASEQ